MSESPHAGYVHGTSPAEQRRLSRLNDLINDSSLRELAPAPGDRILDLGAGLGQLTRALARAVGPSGRVVGIERSAEQIAEAHRQAAVAGEAGLIELRAGSARYPPLEAAEWGSFDIAHARFLLEHVPDPQAVVQAMVRAVRPGGRIVLEDDDHALLRLWPEPAAALPLWQYYVQTYERLGNDPYVGRRLVALLHEAGARRVRNTWNFFGGCAGDERFDAFAVNLIAILEGAREDICRAGELDEARFDDGLQALEAFRRRPDAAIWYAIAWAEGRRPD